MVDRGQWNWVQEERRGKTRQVWGWLPGGSGTREEPADTGEGMQARGQQRQRQGGDLKYGLWEGRVGG